MLDSIPEDANEDETLMVLRSALRQLEEYRGEQRIYIPLSAIEMHVAQLDFQRLSIVDMTDDRNTAMLQEMQSVIDAPGYPDSSNAANSKALYADQIGLLKGEVCAEYRITGFDQQWALNHVERILRQAIELLRYGLFFSSSNLKGIAIGIKGEHTAGEKRVISIPSDYVGWSMSSDRTDAHRTLRVTDRFIQVMTQSGVFELDKMQATLKPTEFEETLLRAAHWIADSTTQLDGDNGFLSLMICLETLFSPEKPKAEEVKDCEPADTIEDAISEGVAIVLTDREAQRKHVKKVIRHLYDQRSRVSHGSYRGIRVQDLETLRLAVRKLMPKIIERHDDWHTRKDFLDWIKSQRPINDE